MANFDRGLDALEGQDADEVERPACAVATGPRDPGDDFVCLRYRVWYASRDCAIRTRYQTAPGCAACDQGRFNLKRHAAELARADRRRRAATGG